MKLVVMILRLDEFGVFLLKLERAKMVMVIMVASKMMGRRIFGSLVFIV